MAQIRLRRAIMTHMYFRENRTQPHLEMDYGLSESSRTLQKVEDNFKRSGKFSFAGLKAIYQCMVADPQNKKLNDPRNDKEFMTGVKKRHTQKAQLMVDFNSKKVASTFFAKGSVHDFNMFKPSLKKTKFCSSLQP